jgi:hypothetical protein
MNRFEGSCQPSAVSKTALSYQLSAVSLTPVFVELADDLLNGDVVIFGHDLL